MSARGRTGDGASTSSGWTRALRRALPVALALAVGGTGACGDGGDTAGAASEGASSRVGAELLSSRNEISGSVPVDVPDGRGESDSRQAVDVSGLGYEWGDTAAPVRILEFSDFGCGYCRQFHTETWPALYEEYVATGKVRWKYVPMVLGMFGPNSENAALAAECAGAQGDFRPVADALFARQSEWKRADEPRPLFREMAREAGVEMEAWERCVSEGARRDRVDAGTTLSRQLGVRGTPTFFVVGYGAIPGAIPLELFSEVLDSVLVQAGTPGAP